MNRQHRPYQFTTGNVRVAACQIYCGPDRSPDDNLARIEDRFREATAKGARLVLFPELCLSGYTIDRRDIRARIRTTPSLLRRVMALTRELNAATVVGIFEEATGRDGAHNTSLAIHRGRIAARYRKIHLPPNERTFEKSDRGAAVADLGFMRLGLSICYDNWFPESARMAFLAGAELLHMPFYWSSEWEVQDDIPRFRTGRNDTTILASRRNRMLKVFPSRALDNGMYLVMLDHANRARKLLQHLPGKSMVFDPYGELLAETKGWVEETICFDFNRQRVQEWRQSPFFPGRNLRSDIYCRAFRSMAQRRI